MEQQMKKEINQSQNLNYHATKQFPENLLAIEMKKDKNKNE